MVDRALIIDPGFIELVVDSFTCLTGKVAKSSFFFFYVGQDMANCYMDFPSNGISTSMLDDS